MLELTRKVSEAIQIGENVTVIVVHIGPGNVKLGFEAPAEVKILCKEVKERDARDARNQR